MKKVIFIILILLGTNILYSQMVVVKGKVTCFHKYALKNIVVSSSKSKSSTTTDEYGLFQIVCMPNETLIFESKSFEAVKRKIKDPKDSITVNLVFKNTKKNREYAIANGLIGEGDLTYAIANLKNENHNFDAYSNIYDLISGRFAGVEVRGKSIIIRGVSSLMADNSALLIVDGVVVEDLSFLSPNDVASIDVLKGVETSLYGSRGANGVVCITTKK